MEAVLEGQTVAIDGTPTLQHHTDFTHTGFINEFIWHIGKIDENVRIKANLGCYRLCDGRPRQQLFFNYGPDYNWMPVIHLRNLPQLRLILRQVQTQYGQLYHSQMCELLHNIRDWSSADITAAYESHDRNLVLIAYVLRGHLVPAQRHYHHFADTRSFDDWLEMILTSEVVYRNIAFRYAFNPTQRHVPKLELLKKDAVMPDLATRKSMRIKNIVMRTPASDNEIIQRLSPFTGVLWERRIFLSVGATMLSKLLQDPTQAPITPFYMPPENEKQTETAPTSAAVTHIEITTSPHSSVTGRTVHFIAIQATDYLHPGQSHKHVSADAHIKAQVQALLDTEVIHHCPTPSQPPAITPPLHPPPQPPPDTSPLPESNTVHDAHDCLYADDDGSADAVSAVTLPTPDNGESDEEMSDTESINFPEPTPPQTPPPPQDNERDAMITISALNQLADMYAPVHPSRGKVDRWVNTYIHNVGGLTEAKLVEIVAVLLAKRCDVAVLLDARITSKQITLTFKHIKTMLTGFHVVIYPTAQVNGVSVGGSVVITSPRVKHKSIHQLCPHGSVVEVAGSVGVSNFAVCAVYVPQQNTAPGSLLTKINVALAQDFPDDPPDAFDHIKDQQHQAVVRHTAAKRLILVGGDFNASLTDTNDPHNFRELIEATSLQSAESATSLLKPTYISGTVSTRIDHVLTTHLQQIQAVAIYRGIMFQHDHAALITSMIVKKVHDLHARWILPLKQLRQAQFDGADADQVAKVHESLATLTVDTSLPPDRQIQQLTEDTMTLIKEICKVHKPARHKFTGHQTT